MSDSAPSCPRCGLPLELRSDAGNVDVLCCDGCGFREIQGATEDADLEPMVHAQDDWEEMLADDDEDESDDDDKDFDDEDLDDSEDLSF